MSFYWKFYFRQNWLLILGAISLPILFWICFWTLDYFHTQKSFLLGWLAKNNLIFHPKIIKVLESEEKEISNWEITNLIIRPRDQKTLSGKEGYDCQLTGILSATDTPIWKVAAKNNQELTLDVISNSTKFYLVGQDKYTEASQAAFKQKDVVLFFWPCPADPSQMIDSEGQIKKCQWDN